jgi:hypothetical protein
MECVDDPIVDLNILDLTPKGHLGLSAYCDLDLEEGQVVTFILRTPPEAGLESKLTPTLERANSLGVSLESGSPLVVLRRILKFTRTYGFGLKIEGD